ncbi:hypothetical protein [Myceligenerans crystallogenes]|uniref:TrbC/VIRB2 family protein n=1 Tax=Myceligenerans crystallogenes TaxID=316335 RepID=A0ABP4ZSK7_9MICO
MSSMQPPAEGSVPGPPAVQPLKRSPAGRTDRDLTIVLIILAPVACALASFWGFFSVSAAGGCSADTCNGTLINLGIWTMVAGPWVVWIVSGIWAIVRLAQNKTGVEVMAKGIVVAVALYGIGNSLMFLGIS